MSSSKRQFHKYPDGSVCKLDGCDTKPRIDWLCAKHYARLTRWGSTDIVHKPTKKNRKCEVIDNNVKCTKKHQAKGMCQMHYRRFTAHGDPLKSLHTGRCPSRYKMVTAVGHPNARPNGRIMEHRLVMSQVIGRELYEHENVHHINGDRYDNRPENLELWSKSQPSGQRIPDKVNWAVELLELYAPNKLRNTK